MNSYDLSRAFWDFAFENPNKIKPNHSAIYFFAIEHCNRLGWKKNFGFPTTMVMEATGIKSYNTYINHLNDLVEFGFIDMIEKSKNQYSSNIIAISKFDKALYKALDKALIKHSTKQSESTIQSTIQSIDSINKQETINKETKKQTPKGESFDFDVYLQKINELFCKKHKVVSKKLKESINARLKQGYTKENFWIAMQNVKNNQYHIDTNYEYIDPFFFAQESKISKYGDKLRDKNTGSNTYQLID